MKIAHPHVDFGEVLSQVLGHFLCQRRDEDALLPLGPQAALAQQVRAGTLDLYAADKQRRQRQPKPTPSRQAQTTTQRKMILHFSQAEYERADIDLRRVQTTMKLATPEATLLYLLREWHEPPAEAAS